MFVNNSINRLRIIIAGTFFVLAMIVSAGDIRVHKIPGGGVNTLIFTDQSGNVVKQIDIEDQSSPETRITTASGTKINRRIELLGNSNYALVTEYIWPVGSPGGKVQETIRLYDAGANELFTLNTFNSTPQALSETGVSVFIQSPAEDWVGTEEEMSRLFDVITVFGLAGDRVFEHKEAPYTVSRIAISSNAKWLVLSVRKKRPSRLKTLVLVNLNTQQIYRETASPNDPIFTYQKVLDDGSLVKISDIGGPVLPDGSIERIKRTIVLKHGIQ